MKKRDWKVLLEDMVTSIQKIENYTLNLSFSNFEKDEMRIDAVVRNLEIIGEACKYIPDGIKKKYPAIPWKSIVGLRNIITHQYFGLDLENIWQIIKTDIPGFKDVLNEISKSKKDCKKQEEL